jgi:hypothetical protein
MNAKVIQARCYLILIIVVFGAALPAEAPAQTPTSKQADTRGCGPGSALLQCNGIGDVRLGVPIAQLKLKCVVVLDTTIVSGSEGLPERWLIVLIGKDSLEVEVQSDRVGRIGITSPRIRTADSLGVGTTARRLRRSGAQLLGSAEGSFYVRIPRLCGLSFRIEGVSDASAWSDIPSKAAVDQVLVVGCHKPA